MSNRREIDPAWWQGGSWEGRDIGEILAARDVAAVFRFAHARGCSWAAIAAATGLTDTRTREIAREDRRVVSYEVLERIGDGLQIPRGRLGLAFAGDAAQPVSGDASPGYDPVDSIVDRLTDLTSVDDDLVLDALQLAIMDIVDEYERGGPTRLAPVAVGLRRRVHAILDHRHHPRRLAQLYRTAGQLSGLLAYMATNSGRLTLSNLYSMEAFRLAELADDNDLRAWIRGTQSFAAYYAGRYGDALNLAEDGLRYAGNGPQAIRLLVNGEARARARLGSSAARDVDAAIGRAFEVADAVAAPPSLTSCISLGPYGRARIAANAATAYLSLGDTRRVLEHATQAIGHVDSAGSVWSRTLIGLDIAGALLADPAPDLEHAVAVAADALDASVHQPIESVRQRAREARQRIATWKNAPAATAFISRYDDWARQIARQPQP